MNHTKSSFHTLQTLSSLSGDNIETLRALNITTLADLLAYPPLRYARYLRAAQDRLLKLDEVLQYVNEAHKGKDIEALLSGSVEVLRDVGPRQAEILKRLGVRSVADLAAFAAVEEAENVVSGAATEDKDPFAPACALPTCKKFSRNSKSYTSFFKEVEIRDLSVYCGGHSHIANLFKFGSVENKVIHLGYSVGYLQEWIYLGVHLGEPQGSVNLSMGQDTQVSMLDWRRAMRTLRAEDTRISERLASSLFHQRAVDEVARATAEEHQHGATSAFGANAATAGSFVAAGAIVGGVGGGLSGSLVGLSLDALAGGTTLGLGTLGGALAGAAAGSVAGAAAGGIIASGATTLGFVNTDAEGDREIFSRSAQDIQQRTVQNSSSIRSFWSNVVGQSVEEEQQTIRTDRLTNHNRIHALNALFFEVLNGYRVNISAKSFAPILFLPFKPFTFSSSVLRSYWWLIRMLVTDKKLAAVLDEKYLRLSGDSNLGAGPVSYPSVDEVVTSRVSVSVNLDSSAVAELIKSGAIAAGGTVAAGLLGLTSAAVIELLRGAMDASKRQKVRAQLVTTNGLVDLVRDSFDEANFIWHFHTNSPIELASITAVRVLNRNDEFEVLGVDLSTLKFEEVRATLSIRNKRNFSGAVPTIGQLEIPSTLSRGFELGALSERDFSWTIGDQIRAKFEGVEALQLAYETAEQAEAVLIDFLNANKFTVTRLILQNIEPEQVMTALEEVRIGDLNLNEIAGTTPIGFCANHVVLPMKSCKLGAGRFGPIGVDTSKLELVLAQLDLVDESNVPELVVYLTGLRDFLAQFIQAAAASGNGSVREAQLLELVTELQQLLQRVLPLVAGGTSGRKPQPVQSPFFALAGFDARIFSAIRRVLAFLKTPISSNSKDGDLLCGYYEAVKATLAKRMGQLLSSDEISLPSPAVFMEPILSNAKGAELYDLRRNSHYALLESPSIASGDPNALRGQTVNLSPTVPDAGLAVQAPPDLPLPSGLTSALAQAGQLNLDTLLTSNAASLTGMLSSLSTMATELAKASASLTGDAQKEALASATDVAKQVGEIVSKSLQSLAREAPLPAPVPAPPPQSQAEKGGVFNLATAINKNSNASASQKRELKQSIGAVTVPESKRDYLFALTFLDQDGVPYVTGAFSFTLALTLFELSEVVEVNGGASINLDPDGHGFLLPERISLTQGRKVKVDFNVNIGGVLVPGTASVVLPDSPDIELVCTMKSEVREVTGTTVKEAIDTAIATGSLGVNGGVLLDLFLNAGAKFPFNIAEANVDGSFKAVPDIKGAYNNSTTTTTGGTTTTGTVTKYKVTTPINGWNVTVR